MLQCEPYQVVGLGAKGWNQKRKNKTKQKKKIPSKSKNSTEGYINQSPHENDIYIHIPYTGDMEIFSEVENSVYETYERTAGVLCCLQN